MSQVSRPMQIALAATLLLLVVWFVALRPKPADGGASASAPAAPAQTTPAAPGTEGLKRAIDKAHGAVTTASGDAQRAAQSSADATTPGAARAGASPGGAAAAPATSSAGSARSHAGSASPPARHVPAGRRVHTVRAALRAHKAIAIAFFDSSTADSQAVERELLHVSRFGGRAFLAAVPLADLSDYPFITNKVQVTVAPTVVIIDPRRRATTIVGFADRGEIEQRLADALSVKPKR